MTAALRQGDDVDMAMAGESAKIKKVLRPVIEAERDLKNKRGALKAVKYHAGQDQELHRIVKALQDIQRKNFYQLTARCKHSGHYYHSGCMSVDVERSDDKELTADAEETVNECLRDFADWIYKQLENEYDYRTGEESCREAIEANDYEFTEKGDMA